MMVVMARSTLVLAASAALAISGSALNAQTAAVPAPVETQSDAQPAVPASAAVAPAQPASPPTPDSQVTSVSQAGHVSQVRIVRLSQVKGQVRLDRNVGAKFEEAFPNLPIVAGARLQTLDGLAEVEFENNSSLRLTPNSLVEFPALQRNASGATSTSVKLLSGSLYVSMADAKSGDDFTVIAGNETVKLTPSSHLRLDLDAPSGRLVVFKGEVAVADPSGNTVVTHKKSLRFDTTSNAAPTFAQADPAVFDKWDKTAADYHRASMSSAFTGSPYAYGSNDLSYYGSFSNFGGGCGSMWRPYLAGANWNPYGSGVWSWYGAGAGYSWVSAYPWGWTPYHSGSWNYCANTGSWGWRAGGPWEGLGNQTSLLKMRGPSRPIAPKPPHPGESTLVGVNLKNIPMSRVDAKNAFVFRSDSAGLGVPRGVFGNLGKVSQTVAQRGVATTSISDGQAQRGMIPISRSVTSNSSRGMGAAQGQAGSQSASVSAFPSSASAGSMRSGVSSPSAGSSMGGGGMHSGASGGSASGGGGGHH